MAVKIKLKRMGKMRSPHYRIVVADARAKRDGRAIEEIGHYHPKEEPSFIEVNSERVQYWLGVGAQPTEPVVAILKVTGDWQTFKGLPGGEGTLRVAAPKADKLATFEAAAKESGATTAPAKDAGAPAAAKAKRAAPAEAAPEPVAEAVTAPEAAPEPAPEPAPAPEAEASAETASDEQA